MAVDKDYIRTLWPEFSSSSDAAIAVLIPVSEAQVSEDAFGSDLYDYAVALLVAHQLKAPKEGGLGAVTSKRVGDLAVSYAAKTGDKSSELDSTWYGQEYKRIRRLCVTGISYV